MALARAAKDLLREVVRCLPRWPFEDRILVWLVPTMRDDVERFHRLDGPAMDRVFRDHQLQSIDGSCVVILLARLEQLAPGLIDALRRQQGENVERSRTR